LGNINTTIYSIAGTTPTAFHDITSGNNIVPCTSGTPTSGAASVRCPTTAPLQIGYSAGAGYDLVTGLGSVNANVLATAWPGLVLTPDFSVGGTEPPSLVRDSPEHQPSRYLKRMAFLEPWL